VLHGCGKADDVPERVTSARPRVVAKTGDVLAADLSEALWLPRESMCRELGVIDCFEAHRIALGGVEPYRKGIHEPLPVAPVAAALAVERIALRACEARVAAELSGDVRLLKPVIAEDDRAAREQVAGALVDRLLRRSATSEETRVLTDLWDDVAAASSDPTRDGPVLTCFAVATSLEHLFY
jgi:hypothetical protein